MSVIVGRGPRRSRRPQRRCATKTLAVISRCSVKRSISRTSGALSRGLEAMTFRTAMVDPGGIV